MFHCPYGVYYIQMYGVYCMQEIMHYLYVEIKDVKSCGFQFEWITLSCIVLCYTQFY